MHSDMLCIYASDMLVACGILQLVYGPEFVLVGCNYAYGAYRAEQIKHGCFLRQVGITDFGLSSFPLVNAFEGKHD